jgi:hypothetical protein
MYFGHGGTHRYVSKIHGIVKIGTHRGFVSVDLRFKNSASSAELNRLGIGIVS